ncbi:MAG: xylosidase [Bacteroidales bacterium]|nr:xylosidase [Bacteroidales bacterium]
MLVSFFSVFLFHFFFSFFLSAKPLHAPESRFMTLQGLVMTGYQGWFNAPEDGANRGWNHYSKNGEFKPGKCTIDMWPDMTEYAVKYKTAFCLVDDSPAYTFSSFDKSTTDLHFQWMQDYGIDGVFMQRFVASIRTAVGLNHTNTVLRNAVEAAEKTDRALCVMYDLSGMKPHEVDLVIEDWKNLVENQKLTSRKDNHYLYHRNKPLVAIWGIGFGDGRLYGYSECERLINFFKNDPVYGGCSMLLGVPTHWRELGVDTDKNPKLHQIIKQADVVQPWLVGRFNQNSYPKYHSLLAKDQAWCQGYDLDYLPVVFPGFTWHNMNPNSPSNMIPRNGGKFFWDQISKSIELGCKMLYIAMFDEIDEGTAIFKIEDVPPVGESVFVGNEGLPSDLYLWLSGQAGRMLRKEILFQDKQPNYENEKINLNK